MVNSLVAFLVSGFSSKPKSQYIDTTIVPLPADDDEQYLPSRSSRGNKTRTAPAPIEAVTTKFDRPPRPAASVSIPLSAYQDLNSFFAPCPPRPDEFKCPRVVYKKYPPKAPKPSVKNSPSLAASAPASASALNQPAPSKRTLRRTFSRISLTPNVRHPPRKNSAPAALGLCKSTSSYDLRDDLANFKPSTESVRPAKEPHYKLRRLQSVDELRSYTTSSSSPSSSPIKNAHSIDYSPNNARYQELVSFVSYIEQSASPASSPRAAQIPALVSPTIQTKSKSPRLANTLHLSSNSFHEPTVGKGAKKHAVKSLKYGNKRPTISYPVLVEQDMVFPRSRQASVQRAYSDQSASSGSSSESETSEADMMADENGQTSTPPLRIRSTRTRLERSNAYAKLEARKPLAGRQRLVSAFDSDSSDASDFEGMDLCEDAQEDEEDLAAVICLFPSPNPSREVSPASTLLSLASSDSSRSASCSSGASSPAPSSALATPLEIHNMHRFDLIFPEEETTMEKKGCLEGHADFNRALLHIDTRRANSAKGCQDDASTIHAADEDAITPTPASTLAYLERQKAKRSERPNSNTGADGNCISVTYSIVEYYKEVMRQEYHQRYSCCSSSYQGGSSIKSSSWDSDADDEEAQTRDPFYLEDDEFLHFMNL